MKQLDKEYFLHLIEKYQSGTATKEEIDFLDAYYDAFKFRDSYINSLDVARRQLLKDDLRNLVSLNIQRNNKPKSLRIKTLAWSISGIAATMLIVIGFLYFPKHNYLTTSVDFINKVDTTLDDSVNDRENNVKIIPGGNKAVLTLANGKKISLTDVNNGMLAEQANVKITKITDGQLVYSVSPNQEAGYESKDNYNTIETPRGGRYKLQLPDGTNVWLNSATKLTFPSSFSNQTNREVILNGEAYFEVAKDASRPFLVKTLMQEIEVLGTHFNVSSYEDDSEVKTTLIEGSVKIIGVKGGDKILKPGQQSILTNDNIIIEEVNTGQLAVAWKNDQFVFESEDIQNVMRMISRWYNVEVQYVGIIPENKFGGAISKFENISEVLRSLESTGKVKFKIEGRRVFVYK